MSYFQGHKKHGILEHKLSILYKVCSNIIYIENNRILSGDTKENLEKCKLSIGLVRELSLRLADLAHN